MKRGVIKLGSLLLVGAIINVAVAWGCVFCLHPFNFTEEMREFDGAWPAEVPADWPELAHHQIFDRVGATDWGAADECVQYQKGVMPQWHVQWVLQAGWPVRSLFLHRNWIEVAGLHGDDPRTIQPAGWREGLRVPGWMKWSGLRRYDVLPAQMLWLGFSINTMFYAAVVWMVFAGPRWLSRKRRVRRGWCVACAYDLRGRESSNEVCPECGAAIRHGNSPGRARG